MAARGDDTPARKAAEGLTRARVGAHFGDDGFDVGRGATGRDMITASPLTTEGTRLGQCVQGVPSKDIWSLAIEHGGTNRGYRAVRGEREGRLGSKEPCQKALKTAALR